MSCDIVWRNRATRSISQIRIVLRLEHRLSKACVWLIHSDDSGIVRVADAVSREGKRVIHLNAGAIHDRQNIGSMCCFWNYDGEQVARLPWPHRLLLDFIKPLQPVLAILRGVLQQKESSGGHVVSDVESVSFVAWLKSAEVRIIIF